VLGGADDVSLVIRARFLRGVFQQRGNGENDDVNVTVTGSFAARKPPRDKRERERD